MTAKTDTLEHQSSNGTEPPAPPVQLPPLNITGMVVAKADLIASLRIWVPQLTDIAPLGDDRFILTVGPMQQMEGEH